MVAGREQLFQGHAGGTFCFLYSVGQVRDPGKHIVIKKSRIQETSNLSTDADNRTDTTVGWTKNTQKPKKIIIGKNNPKQKNSKTSRGMPKLSIYPLTRGL